MSHRRIKLPINRFFPKVGGAFPARRSLGEGGSTATYRVFAPALSLTPAHSNQPRITRISLMTAEPFQSFALIQCSMFDVGCWMFASVLRPDIPDLVAQLWIVMLEIIP